jgi:hypothetical protein
MMVTTAPVNTNMDNINPINVNKIEPDIPYIFNLESLIYEGANMFFPGIEERMSKQQNTFFNDDEDTQHQILVDGVNDADTADDDDEDFWMITTLPGIIQDVGGYESNSVYARSPYESDDDYEQRLMLLMDVTYPEMEELEAQINVYLAEMN